ncbi:ABC transporter permease subunit [Streptomyces sp. S3(2020)]|uniref:ABC transporter permease n=1 Tax=Streptomyces sp. S3(2020) TaxID=2732044 RepID=UPI001489902E|nr:ABC transporter permease subunit [Streptomyces sp. S3(2020)]NNN29175.1 ABC transporter permease subunit [Streptomyces sp. S3(2020)]
MNWLFDSRNWTGGDGVPTRLAEHLEYSVAAVAIALLIALPLGLAVGHTSRGKRAVVGLANALRALPTLGVVVLLVILLSPHMHSKLAFYLPSTVVLVLLAVPPILTNVVAGIDAIDRNVLDAARGVGLGPLAIAFGVELPCAAPLVLAGVRNAFLQVISGAAIAAYVSLGGLGRLIIDGQAQQNLSQMLAGGVLIAALVIAVDAVFALLSKVLVSPGLSRSTGRLVRLRPSLMIRSTGESNA